MSDTARWNLIVSRSTDDALRQLLADQGGCRKGSLSRFVEEAVQARIFEITAEAARQQNAHLSADEIAGIVDEALGWARGNAGPAGSLPGYTRRPKGRLFHIRHGRP